ncbi:MAG: glycosyltransferase [Akkermansia sp.]|nr:glycosyltransferase [Akkermansia sp.]
MKVMHLLPSLTSGGVEQVVLELCESLVAGGDESVVVSGGGPMVADIEKTGARHITMPVGKKSLKSLFLVRKLAKLIEHEAPDVLNLHSRVPAWLGHWAWKKVPAKKRPKILSTFHGYYSVNGYSAVMTKGDTIVAVSRFIREHILECYPKTQAEKIIVIPNSVDTSVHNPEYRPSEEWYEKWYSDFPEMKGKYLICLPARVTRHKGAAHLEPILLELKKRGIPAHAVIVGEVKKGKEAFKLELKKKFEQAGLTHDVTWTGLRRDVRDIMVACNVIVSLNLIPEAFGKTTLEALALGRPTAGYEAGGVGEQLDDYLPEGKVPTGDTMAMADVLAKWYTNPPTPKLPLTAPYRRKDMTDAYIAAYKALCGK